MYELESITFYRSVKISDEEIDIIKQVVSDVLGNHEEDICLELKDLDDEL